MSLVGIGSEWQYILSSLRELVCLPKKTYRDIKGFILQVAKGSCNQSQK